MAKEKVIYRNSDISAVIDEFIHDKRNRELLKRRYIDGIRIEPLAEEFELSERRVRAIIYQSERIIFSNLP